MRARPTTLHADINVTPLVDVCLVLLIIFMVVTPIIVNGVPVHLPKVAASDQLDAKPLQVTINADRTLYVGNNVIRSEELANELARARASANRPVIVRGDKTLKYGDVVEVLAACRAAGFEDVGLATEKP